MEQESHNIRSTLSLITEIAFQSKVLALNAAIEASEAGEHGRGFKVVSDGIHAMAARTTEATETISAVMSELTSNAARVSDTMTLGRARVKEVMERAERVTEVFQRISASSTTISGMSNQIAVSTREQVSALGEIRGHIESIKELGAATSSDAAQTASSSSDLRDQVTGLDALVAQFRIARSADDAVKTPVKRQTD